MDEQKTLEELRAELSTAISQRDENLKSMDRLSAQLSEKRQALYELAGKVQELSAPIPMLLTCPSCGARHIDQGEFATKHHHTHACQHCGMCWRPAVVSTVGVKFLPGFKDE